VAFALVVAVLSGLAGCKDSATPIKSLLDDPGRFDGTTVRVVGDVTESVGILDFGAYRVNDGTGSLLVVSKQQGAPREGAKVGVEGTFRAVFTFQAQSIAALEEGRRYEP
jgi:hypothetical protein